MTSRGSRGDDGNAMVEFVLLAVLLMVPLVYVLLTVFRVQAGAYAVSSAAREAGRVYVISDDGAAAADRAATAAAIVLQDSGLELDADELRLHCSVDPCLTPGGTVEVEVGYDVALPLLPDLLADRAPASIHVSSRHLEVVDRFRAAAR